MSNSAQGERGMVAVRTEMLARLFGAGFRETQLTQL